MLLYFWRSVLYLFVLTVSQTQTKKTLCCKAKLQFATYWLLQPLCLKLPAQCCCITGDQLNVVVFLEISTLPICADGQSDKN
jgi:hypothetical protein